MAKGIDTYAHIGCLNSGGKTIAVLPCGFKYIFPKENTKLYNEILNVVNELDDVIIQDGDKKNSKTKDYNNTPTLNQYGIDLTKKALEGKLDPVIGRKEEIQR